MQVMAVSQGSGIIIIDREIDGQYGRSRHWKETDENDKSFEE